jgi:hypothetical protein
MEDHTIRHLRDFRLSPLLNQNQNEQTSCEPRDLALEEFKRIDESHRPQPLPTEVLDELDRILITADKEADRIA